MKRFVLALVSVILLCGCSADKPKEDGINNVTNLTEKVDNTCSADRDYNLVPTIKEANHEDMDIAVYKANWNGEEKASARATENSAERFIPLDAGVGQAFEFVFSDNAPDIIRGTEWILNDVETALKNDPDIICTDIEGVLDGKKFTFSISGENKSGFRIEKRMIVLNCKWKNGDEIEYAFLLDVTDGAVAENFMYEADDITAIPGVAMTIDSDGIISTYAFVDMKNDTDKYITVSDWYRIDVLRDDVWYKMNYTSSDPAVSWKSEGYGLPEGYDIRLVTEWKELYGELEAGNYRLVKGFRFEGNPTEYEICAAFTVPALMIN